MTEQLEKVVHTLEQLPQVEQNALAQLIEDELLWDLSLQNSQQQLAYLADEALLEFRAGLTKRVD